ncbi:hypothetical protein BN1012_Phect1178 [Candidatus Phaeomarinobacter ectocarpi]|uniref:Uncharacterized protein n=1 Tax=Candidatus Phaeomarinibacter ectocarpi TaxID=1458461 RepID=X5MCP2_9HYPH|nr:hypothetical protein BN1012_Phect1178 [Candidatus Phaeomarinobacter ectocarpi]
MAETVRSICARISQTLSQDPHIIGSFAHTSDSWPTGPDT